MLEVWQKKLRLENRYFSIIALNKWLLNEAHYWKYCISFGDQSVLNWFLLNFTSSFSLSKLKSLATKTVILDDSFFLCEWRWMIKEKLLKQFGVHVEISNSRGYADSLSSSSIVWDLVALDNPSYIWRRQQQLYR